MRKFAASIFLIILFTGPCPGQSWENKYLDNQISVDFPSIPKVHKVENKVVYQIIASDYIVQVIKTDMSALYPDFNVQQNELSDFYDGVIKGLLNTATNSKLLKEQQINLDNYEGREIKFVKDFQEWKNISVSSRFFLIGKTLYSFDIWDLSNERPVKLVKKFFGSIKLDK